MKISVAMTTYNGEKYVLQQLESLRVQQRQIDEVLIADDRSTDGTATAVRTYIERHDLEGWVLTENKTNLGWMANFHACIARTTGDIVFFCDQDDVWHKDKIEKMVMCLEQRPEISALACRMRLINSVGIPYRGNRSEKTEAMLVRKSLMDDRFIYNIAPGCTMAVRKEFLQALDIPGKEALPHDAYYWKTAVLLGSGYWYNEPLMDYRIHENNASNPAASQGKKQIKSISVRSREIQTHCNQLKELKGLCQQLAVFEKNRQADARLTRLIEFCQGRQDFIRKTGDGALRYAHNNLRYYNGVKMFMGDFLCRIRGADN